MFFLLGPQTKRRTQQELSPLILHVHVKQALMESRVEHSCTLLPCSCAHEKDSMPPKTDGALARDTLVQKEMRPQDFLDASAHGYKPLPSAPDPPP
jgi:hypothetical protein